MSLEQQRMMNIGWWWWWCGMIFVLTFASIVPTYIMWSRSNTSWWWWWWWLHRWSNKPPPSHGIFSSLMWQTKGRSSDLYVRYQKGLACFGSLPKGEGRKHQAHTIITKWSLSSLTSGHHRQIHYKVRWAENVCVIKTKCLHYYVIVGCGLFDL